MKNPCNGCTLRNPFCHIPGNCKKSPTYEEWRAEIAAAKKAKNSDIVVADFKAKNIKRTRKARNLRKE